MKAWIPNSATWLYMTGLCIGDGNSNPMMSCFIGLSEVLNKSVFAKLLEQGLAHIVSAV